MDRTNPLLAASIDALAPGCPATDRDDRRSREGASTPVSLCGGLASDPLGAAGAGRPRHFRIVRRSGGIAVSSQCHRPSLRYRIAAASANVRCGWSPQLRFGRLPPSCSMQGGNAMIAVRMDRLQPLGRALMLPIAVLPIAGLLLRLGQPDLLEHRLRRCGGRRDLLSSGIALRDRRRGRPRAGESWRGGAGRRGLLPGADRGREGAADVPPDAAAAFTDSAARDLANAAWKAKQLDKLSVPAGILSGVAAGMLYNRFSEIKLPDYLAFFGGRRFVPIVAGAAGLVGAVLFGVGFPCLETGIDQLSQWVVALGQSGAVRLRLAQPHPDRHRAPPHHQQHRLVHHRRLSTARPAI